MSQDLPSVPTIMPLPSIGFPLLWKQSPNNLPGLTGACLADARLGHSLSSGSPHRPSLLLLRPCGTLKRAATKFFATPPTGGWSPPLKDRLGAALTTQNGRSDAT